MITCTNLCRIMTRTVVSRWWRQHPGKHALLHTIDIIYVYMSMLHTPRWIAAVVTTVALGGRGSSNQLHPHPAFLPTFDYLGVTRSQDGDSCLRPFWASKMLFRNLRITSRTLRPCFLYGDTQKKIYIYIYIYIYMVTPWGSGLSIWIETGLWKRGISFLELS